MSMVNDGPHVSLREFMDSEVSHVRDQLGELRGDADSIQSDVRSLRDDVHAMRSDWQAAATALEQRLARVVTWPMLVTALTLGLGVATVAISILGAR